MLLPTAARVNAIDRSRPLREQAHRRHSPHATFSLGGIAEPLDFPDSEFDLVTASLVMLYLHDWQTTLPGLVGLWVCAVLPLSRQAGPGPG